MTAPQDHEEWIKDYDDSSQLHHHNDLLNQQQLEERKKMEWEPKDNSINIFKNKYKNKDSDPLLTGNGLVDGKEWKVKAWKNEDKNGKSYFSLKFYEPQDSGQGYSKPQKTADDEIPF
tara:strand:+ start:67 stop:420 length:354 start_codon:yes stop_codon:yes gene_type:complete